MTMEKKKTVGRPTKYTENLADKICHAISNTSKGLSRICKENVDFPCRDTIHDWIKTNDVFSDKYTRAKQTQAEFLVDEILEISDYSAEDTVIDDYGKVKPNNELINRSRLRVDTRKWIASKVLPKVYGDKVTNEHVGKDGGAIQTSTSITVAEIDQRILSLLSNS